jgi:chorismate mutase
MSSEVTALEVLQKQVESLTGQLQTLTSERDEYRDAVVEISAERDSLKTAPDAATRIAELEASIRDRTHFDKFAELAKGAKAKDAALKHLWQVSGYKAEADDIDERALQSLVAKLKQDADYAFDPEPSDTTKAAQDAARPTSRTKYGLDIGSAAEPAGGGRASRNQGADGTIVTQEMRADPKFMLDPKNRELIRDAAIGGRFR